MRDLRLSDKEWRDRVGFCNIMSEVEIARSHTNYEKSLLRERIVARERRRSVGGTGG